MESNVSPTLKDVGIIKDHRKVASETEKLKFADNFMINVGGLTSRIV